MIFKVGLQSLYFYYILGKLNLSIKINNLLIYKLDKYINILANTPKNLVGWDIFNYWDLL